MCIMYMPWFSCILICRIVKLPRACVIKTYIFKLMNHIGGERACLKGGRSWVRAPMVSN